MRSDLLHAAAGSFQWGVGRIALEQATYTIRMALGDTTVGPTPYSR
ncbi:MAG: hypothetical protein RBR35_00535 [Salinivirgaceae bacterium]|nr:hypothetical protein [Salinivirgaceae bacterium]